MSPAAFLRAQKMHAAAELLRSTDRTVLDIAGQFGYDNASKFARAFRSVIGVSPNAYRSGATADRETLPRMYAFPPCHIISHPFVRCGPEGGLTNV